ncbi:hypothetical protein Gogos_001599 [Gossypium gossypioides]|uniref:Uncharacterized protein n=1 Tax=Gossypium gossypioides TaxID=34282 RepID=A0A7J9CWI6_GOSGO|nr:hypothetical protein [Gossypium gossypioides]
MEILVNASKVSGTERTFHVPGFGMTKKKKKGRMFQNKHFKSPDEYQ